MKNVFDFDTPVVWIFNIGAERFWYPESKGLTNSTEETVINYIEEINLLITREIDYIIMRKKPDAFFLDNLIKMGFKIPEILLLNINDEKASISELILRDEIILNKIKELVKSHKVKLLPYAITNLEEKISAICKIDIILEVSSEMAIKINDKISSRKIAQKLNFPICKGYICNSIDELICRFEELIKETQKVVIKEPHGASGKGLYIVDNLKSLKYIARLIKRINNGSGKWLIEKWYHKKFDLNCQLFITEKGTQIFSIKKQLLDGAVYVGSLNPFIIEEELLIKYKEYMTILGNYLLERGYRGVVGVDSIITVENEIIPLVEINGRFTLSTYTSFLENIFGHVFILNRYFRVLSGRYVSYEDLNKILLEKDLLYSKCQGTGVLLYNSGTLPIHPIIENSEQYIGRIFCLIISSTEEDVYKIADRLQKILQGYFKIL
ncbi:ATP-grasp domain-containing protein [Paenibacillus solani]|uniref:ATP-grasp domain-containing protein n=1 Tax=Paenibacillus solani TaxID=1705565 RepID=UPI003D266A8B